MSSGFSFEGLHYSPGSLGDGSLGSDWGPVRGVGKNLWGRTSPEVEAGLFNADFDRGNDQHLKIRCNDYSLPDF